MFDFRISRRIVLWLVLMYSVLTCLGIVHRHYSLSIKSCLDLLTSSYVHRIFPEDLEINSQPKLEERLVSLYHTRHPTSNLHIARISEQCHLQPEPETQHLHFDSVPIMRIVMNPLNDANLKLSSNRKRDEEEDESGRYFNPAFIPLPLHFNLPLELLQTKTSFTYLLISRLVTEGLHQESHYCFATIQSKISSTNSKMNQQMRCLTPPRPLDIPPTPSNHCTGAWTSFPDIPGFHDPRIFWSGRGEPLIIVNSGSTYGCVGLWIMDLRAIIPELARGLHGEEPEWTRLPITFGHLTEITKNHRESRNEVEKNWVLFFPNRNEAIIVYEAMARALEVQEQQQGSIVDKLVSGSRDGNEDALESFSSAISVSEVESGWKESDRSVVTSDLFAHAHHNSSDLSRVDSSNALTTHLYHNTTSHGTNWLNSTTVKLPLRSMQSSSIDATDSKSNTSRTNQTFVQTIHTHSARHDPNITILGGRTQALLLAHGYTTPNLTHPSEPSCFDVSSYMHTHDHLDNKGHWHQGSGSLRLVLCTRAQVREGTCVHRDREQGSDSSLENDLIREGLMVHFALVHRKFSNDWDLPMRYERYVMVWEARRPWRVVGMSKWPLAFEGEGVRMKSNAEPVVLRRKRRGGGMSPHTQESGSDDLQQHEVKNEEEQETPVEIDDDGLNLETAYFTYSPSIAWAWRREDDVQLGLGQMKDDGSSLGTGFLDDEVLVGIGIDDTKQGFARVKAEMLLQCLRLCPGVEPVKHRAE